MIYEIKVSNVVQKNDKNIRLICCGGQHFELLEPYDKNARYMTNQPMGKASLISKRPCDGQQCAFLQTTYLPDLADTVEGEYGVGKWFGNEELMQEMGLFAPLKEPICKQVWVNDNGGFCAYKGYRLLIRNAGTLFFIEWERLRYRVPKDGEEIIIQGTFWREGASEDIASEERTIYIRRGAEIVEKKGE